MMNADKLKNIISKKAHGNSNISQKFYQLFYFERILERISISNYKGKIILKGGLLLTSIIGEDERTTKDMDATLKGIPLTKNHVEKVFNEIFSIDIDDGVVFKIISIKDIRLEDEYGGFRLNILSKLDNNKNYICVELPTGDVITPREMKYNYNSIFEDKKIPIMSYTLETVLAEKIETILSRLELNGRAKDFYDIYLIYTKEWKNINLDHFRKAIDKTFTKREYNGNSSEALDIIKNSEALKERWNKYQKNFEYAEEIEFEDIMNCLEKMIGQFAPIGV